MKRINSSDIAREAGVSRSTVSRVINNYSNVPDATREKVMRIIKEHHYYPQVSGQMLSGKSSDTIGLFWIGSASIAGDQLASSFLLHVIDEASLRNRLVLTVILPDLTESSNIRAVRKMFKEGRIDGGVFVGVTINHPFIQELIDDGEIIGVFDYVPSREYKNLVTANLNPADGQLAIDYLHAMGHRSIMILDGDMTRQSSFTRHEGFLQGLAKNCLPIEGRYLAYAGISQEQGYLVAKRMLEQNLDSLPTAICATNDSVAFGTYQALFELGLSIGEQVSVIGFDGHMHNPYANPPLTSVEYDYKTIFRTLIDRVIDLTEGKELLQHNYVFNGTLTVRSSVKNLLG